MSNEQHDLAWAGLVPYWPVRRGFALYSERLRATACEHAHRTPRAALNCAEAQGRVTAAWTPEEMAAVRR